ncbi:RES family NAD+ phosphorylase [Vibrio sp. MACH09]|uniref:RES family NAD+ phosphorylase n=1 Tax=Vibrio sp. MACH09 TaxID=3025122 RepID=UPI00295E904C|nr:RES family NAD+ phosphorylase [Vibrio sp. MACH09]
MKPPKGKAFKGDVYRYEKPEYIETLWDLHPGNINADHRYTSQGQGGVYAGTSQKTALDEISHYDPNAQDLRVALTKEVNLENVLDLTDIKVRNQLYVSLEDITKSGDYSKTQEIGKWAKQNGYDGILAPSARNPEGSNLVIIKNE